MSRVVRQYLAMPAKTIRLTVFDALDHATTHGLLVCVFACHGMPDRVNVRPEDVAGSCSVEMVNLTYIDIAAPA